MFICFQKVCLFVFRRCVYLSLTVYYCSHELMTRRHVSSCPTKPHVSLHTHTRTLTHTSAYTHTHTYTHKCLLAHPDATGRYSTPPSPHFSTTSTTSAGATWSLRRRCEKCLSSTCLSGWAFERGGGGGGGGGGKWRTRRRFYWLPITSDRMAGPLRENVFPYKRMRSR